MTKAIKPTVGRSILYYPKATDPGAKPPPGQAHAAIVSAVWTDTCINIAYFDANGVSFNATSVLLVQGDEHPEAGYAAWMPYQVGQAAKHEPVERLPAHRDGLVKHFLPAGTTVKIGGLPLQLDHPAVVWTHPANITAIFESVNEACKPQPAE